MTEISKERIENALNADLSAYHEQWGDSEMPITKEEDYAYRAGWEDGFFYQSDIVEKLADALDACLRKGAKWHPCDDVVVNGQQALKLAGRG